MCYKSLELRKSKLHPINLGIRIYILRKLLPQMILMWWWRAQAGWNLGWILVVLFIGCVIVDKLLKFFVSWFLHLVVNLLRCNPLTEIYLDYFIKMATFPPSMAFSISFNLILSFYLFPFWYRKIYYYVYY